MECKIKGCRRKRRKNANLFNDPVSTGRQSSLSSDSESRLRPLGGLQKPGKELIQDRKHDYLTRIFEKKKLKEKSLSKKMKTPLDRKLNRSRWPVKLKKVSKIKEKPQEKRKSKPSHKSLTKKRFSYVAFNSNSKDSSSELSSSEVQIFRGNSTDEVFEFIKKFHFLYEPVTPQMLIDVVQDPEHSKSGATLDMITAKLRARTRGLNPATDLLKEEVFQKLCCAMKLGLIEENNGFYTIAEYPGSSKLPRKIKNAFWKLWYRRMTKSCCQVEIIIRMMTCSKHPTNLPWNDFTHFISWRTRISNTENFNFY